VGGALPVAADSTAAEGDSRTTHKKKLRAQKPPPAGGSASAVKSATDPCGGVKLVDATDPSGGVAKTSRQPLAFNKGKGCGSVNDGPALSRDDLYGPLTTDEL